MSAALGPEWDEYAIGRAITPVRLQSYQSAARGDLHAALRLYDWNAVASAAVLMTVAMVEVITRNAMDSQLSAWAARRGEPSWFETIPLDGKALAALEHAFRKVEAAPCGNDFHGKVVAELSFGFWRILVAQRYLTSLWVPALNKAFPYGYRDIRERRFRVEQNLAALVAVRNRAAHHEPIHGRDLLADLRSAVEVATWVDVDAGAWVAARSPLESVVRRRPRAG
ncbi:hypothetical protein L5I01_00765 [Gordonia sp. HY442]|uniref:hypothetical protein n=1 Tax=Gordonia zhenghanii TaxID=2911516 RepID=UPI001F1B1FE0|nr:hypothetical protein [Gordonia zhenghanii]MCF8601883.1 hypothetical protein [Gordonia zhenghanii]